MPEALNAQWSGLFTAASTFRELGPWAWMDDGQVFGVQDSITKEIAWCAVLGMRGEVFGLAAYLGTPGLDIHTRIHAGELTADDDEIRFGFPCLLTSFENRKGLQASDLALIRSLGLAFRGPNGWPQFRSHRRGWYPWRLDASEVPCLAEVLQQATDVCGRLRSEPSLLNPPHARELLVRVKDGHWVDRWMKPAPQTALVLPGPLVDEHGAAALKSSTTDRQGIWEADLFYFPTPTRENVNERPYYPVAMVWADQNSSLVLAAELLPQADDPDLKANALTGQLLNLAKKHGRIPQAIHVPRSSLAKALSQVADILGCKVIVSERLPALEDVKEQLFARFVGR